MTNASTAGLTMTINPTRTNLKPPPCSTTLFLSLARYSSSKMAGDISFFSSWYLPWPLVLHNVLQHLQPAGIQKWEGFVPHFSMNLLIQLTLCHFGFKLDGWCLWFSGDNILLLPSLIANISPMSPYGDQHQYLFDELASEYYSIGAEVPCFNPSLTWQEPMFPIKNSYNNKDNIVGFCVYC